MYYKTYAFNYVFKDNLYKTTIRKSENQPQYNMFHKFFLPDELIWGDGLIIAKPINRYIKGMSCVNHFYYAYIMQIFQPNQNTKMLMFK